jgi:hypothetical protein
MKGISILEEVREDRGLGRNTLHEKKHKNLTGRGNKKSAGYGRGAAILAC